MAIPRLHRECGSLPPGPPDALGRMETHAPMMSAFPLIADILLLGWQQRPLLTQADTPVGKLPASGAWASAAAPAAGLVKRMESFGTHSVPARLYCTGKSWRRTWRKSLANRASGKPKGQAAPEKNRQR